MLSLNHMSKAQPKRHDSDSDPEADESDDGMPMMGPEHPLASASKRGKKRARRDAASSSSSSGDDDDNNDDRDKATKRDGEDNGEDGSNGEDNSDSDGENSDVLTVDFDFENVKEIDYHGMKSLLEKSHFRHRTHQNYRTL